MRDVVVDTNVLVHCNNSGVSYHETAKKCIDLIDNDGLCICVDDVFTLDSSNTSFVGHEYFKHLRTGTLGFAFVLKMLMEDRIKQIVKDDHKGIKKELRGKISKSRDVVFVIIAYGSKSKVLITNDFDDFNNVVRSYLKKAFNVNLCCSSTFSV